MAQFDLSKASDEVTEQLPEKIPPPDVEIDGKNIFINRPWVQQFLFGKPSESDASTVKPKQPLTPGQKAARARRLKIMEIERRKALKAAKLRMKLKKFGQTPGIDEMLIIPEVVS